MADNPRRKHGTPHKYSAEEVARAVDKFKREGGLVQRLPDQQVSKNVQIAIKDFTNSPAYEAVGISYSFFLKSSEVFDD